MDGKNVGVMKFVNRVSLLEYDKTTGLYKAEPFNMHTVLRCGGAFCYDYSYVLVLVCIARLLLILYVAQLALSNGKTTGLHKTEPLNVHRVMCGRALCYYYYCYYYRFIFISVRSVIIVVIIRLLNIQ
jgi:hypothetical protein